jgi:hypothetical protein
VENALDSPLRRIQDFDLLDQDERVKVLRHAQTTFGPRPDPLEASRIEFALGSDSADITAKQCLLRLTITRTSEAPNKLWSYGTSFACSTCMRKGRPCIRTVTDESRQWIVVLPLHVAQRMDSNWRHAGYWVRNV